MEKNFHRCLVAYTRIWEIDDDVDAELVKLMNDLTSTIPLLQCLDDSEREYFRKQILEYVEKFSTSIQRIDLSL